MQLSWPFSLKLHFREKTSFDTRSGRGQVVSVLPAVACSPFACVAFLVTLGWFAFSLLVHSLLWCALFILVQLDDFEIQQHYDEFFEEVYVEMEKVGINILPHVFMPLVALF